MMKMPEASHYVVVVEVKQVFPRQGMQQGKQVDEVTRVVTTDANKTDAINKAIAFLVVERGAAEGRQD